MNESKPIWQSKTLWLNVAVVAAEILTVVMANDFVKANPSTVAWMGTAHAILNVIVRVFTVQPVTITGAK